MKTPQVWIKRRSLSVKLPLAVIALVYGVALVSGLAAQWREARVVRAALEDGAKQLSSSLALSNAEYMVHLDYWAMYSSLRRQVDAIDRSLTPLIFGAIVDVRGTLMAHTQPDLHRIGQSLAEADAFLDSADSAEVRYGSLNDRNVLLASAPVEYGGKRIGYVCLAYDTAFIQEKVLASIFQIGAIATFLAVVASFLGWWLSRRMIRPLDDLKDAIDRIRSGQVAEVEPLPIQERDEIGSVTQAFNEMAEQLKERETLSNQLFVSEKLAAIGRLVSGIAHEINNPLGGMKNAVETLRVFGDDPVKHEESLRLISMGLQHVGDVVEALLLQHRGQGRIVLCDPHCLDDLFLLIRHECDSRRIAVSWTNDITGSFMMARTQLQQVLTNLLTNAVNATPEGGRILFIARETATALLFSVGDSGRGLSQEDLQKVYEPFYTTRPEGTGLGLWVSLQLVQSLGGAIEVDSIMGAGTTFHVIIPKVQLNMSEKRNDETVAD